MAVLPHPFEPLPKDDIRALAKEKYEAVARALTDGETTA